MVVGVMTVELRLPENHSLKGKRGVIKSIIGRVQNRFNVSIAEVADNDLWQTAQIGVAAVSNAADYATGMLEAVVDFIEGERLDIEVLDYAIEILHL